MKNFFYFSAVCVYLFATINAVEQVSQGCLEKEKALALLETSESLLNKARLFFPSCKENINTTDESECGKQKSLAYIEISKKMISDVRRNFPACFKLVEKEEKIIKDEKFKNCAEILASGHNESGVYTIWLGENSTTARPLEVYCDMETDKGGWTVIQRRQKLPVQEDFYKDWESYKNGFGNVTEEHWLGNENIRILCLNVCEIRFDLEDEKGEKGFALYQNFYLSGTRYRLHIMGYTGNVGDNMQVHDNIDFATKDKGYIEKANIHKGGWWYGDGGYYANLNGVYLPGESNDYTVHWYKWRKDANLGKVEIKVRSQ